MRKDRGGTFHSRLPHGVGVSEARDDVVGDGESELEAVAAAVLEGEGEALGVRDEGDGEDDVGAVGGEDGEVLDLHIWLEGL